MAIDFNLTHNLDWLTAELKQQGLKSGKRDTPMPMQLEGIDTNNDGCIRLDEYRRFHPHSLTGHSIKSALATWFSQGVHKLLLPHGFVLYDNGNHQFDPKSDVILNKESQRQIPSEVIAQIAPEYLPIFETGFNWGLLEWHLSEPTLEASAKLLMMGRLIDGLHPTQTSHTPAIDALLSWFDAVTSQTDVSPDAIRIAAKALFHALPKVQDKDAIRLFGALNKWSPQVWRALLEDLDFCLEMPKTLAFALRQASPKSLSELFDYLQTDSPLALIISAALARLEPKSTYKKVFNTFDGDLDEEIFAIAAQTIKEDGQRHPSETVLAFEVLKALLIRSATHKGDASISDRCMDLTLTFLRTFHGVPESLPMTWLSSIPKVRALTQPTEPDASETLERRYVIKTNRRLAESAFQTLILVGGSKARDGIVTYLHEPLVTNFDPRFVKDPAHVAYFLRVEGIKTLGILAGHQQLYWNGEKLKEINEIGRRLEAVFWGDTHKQQAMMDELASAGSAGDLHTRLISNLGDRALKLSANYATLHYLKNLYLQNPDPLQAPAPDTNDLMASWDKPLPLPEDPASFSDFLLTYRTRTFEDENTSWPNFGAYLDALGTRYAKQIPFAVFLNGLNQTEICDYLTETVDAQAQALRAIFQLKSWTSGLHGRFLTWWNTLNFLSITPGSSQEAQVLAAIDGLSTSGLSALAPNFLITAMTAPNQTIAVAAQMAYTKLHFPQSALTAYFDNDTTLDVKTEKSLIRTGSQSWLSIFSFLRKFNLERRAYPHVNPEGEVKPIDPESWQQDMRLVNEHHPDRYERHVKKLVKSHDTETVSLLLEALVTPVELTNSDQPLRYLMSFWGRFVPREKLQSEIIKLLANENSGKASPIDFLKVLIKWSQRNRIDLIDAFIDAFDTYQPARVNFPPEIRTRIADLSSLSDPTAQAQAETDILEDIASLIAAMPNPNGFLDQMIASLYNVKRAEFIYQTLRNMAPEQLSKTLELSIREFVALESLNAELAASRMTSQAYEQAKHDATIKIGLLELILSRTEPKHPFTIGEMFSAGFRLLRGSGALL
jgi:hypothetical protein